MTALTAVVFDWAGTVLDFGSQAPVSALIETFARFDLALGEDEARTPMGLAKRDHIAALLRQPDVSAAWQARHGRAPGEADIDAVTAVFEPLSAEAVRKHAHLVSGAADLIDTLRRRGLKIGSTTGYSRDTMRRLAPLAAAQGFDPDNIVCAGDLPEGRPSPLMMYRTFADLGVYPPQSVVKVDDTGPGLQEARGAGSWAVGVVLSSAAMGLSSEAVTTLRATDPGAYDVRRLAIVDAHFAAGAHHVVDTVADLVPALEAIAARLARGERP